MEVSSQCLANTIQHQTSRLPKHLLWFIPSHHSRLVLVRSILGKNKFFRERKKVWERRIKFFLYLQDKCSLRWNSTFDSVSFKSFQCNGGIFQMYVWCWFLFKTGYYISDIFCWDLPTWHLVGRFNLDNAWLKFALSIYCRKCSIWRFMFVLIIKNIKERKLIFKYSDTGWDIKAVRLLFTKAWTKIELVNQLSSKYGSALLNLTSSITFDENL